MYSLILQFILGVILLIFTTYFLIKVAEKISWILQLSPLIIGTTIVALGTSLPELTVSGIAILNNDVGLAMGNIIGSNIVNILLVLPVGILIGKLRIGTTKTQIFSLLVFAVTALFILLQLFQLPSILPGIILLATALIITFGVYEWGLFGRDHEDLRRFKKHSKGKLTIKEPILLLLLVIGTIIGGKLIVSSVERMSVITGISTTIFGLTLTAIATSFPELLTTIFSQEDHQEKITIGNIAGSNIYNLLLIGGLIMFFSNNRQVLFMDLFLLAISTLFFVLIVRYYKGKTVSKWIGLILFSLFFVYLVLLR